MVHSNNSSLSLPKGFPGLPEGWTQLTESFASKQSPDTKLFARRFCSPQAGHRVLIVFHGMGEHSGRYGHVPHYVAHQVDEVYCPDMRGHGYSEGARGHIGKFDHLVDDAAQIIEQVAERVRAQFGKLELHVLAHSLGGHVVTRLLFLHLSLPIQSVSLSAPFLKIKFPVPAVKLAAAKMLASIYPSLPLDTGLEASHLSHDPEVIRTYLGDSLNHSKMTPGFFKTMLQAFDDTWSRNSGISVPLQVLLPGDDLIVDENFGRNYYDALQHPKKKVQLYPALYHEPLNDIAKDRVFGDVCSWIQENAKR